MLIQLNQHWLLRVCPKVGIGYFSQILSVKIYTIILRLLDLFSWF